MSTQQAFFSQVTVSYQDVPVSANGIDATKFLLATEDLIKLFDYINATAFGPVKSDMNGNIKKIRDKQANFVTLQEVVLSENSGSGKKEATTGLLWLSRGLDFTSQALRRNIENPSEELSVSFTKAYELTLQKHHSFLVRPVFQLAMKACPRRKDFYKKVGGSDDEAAVVAQLKPWLEGLEAQVKIVNEFYEAHVKL